MEHEELHYANILFTQKCLIYGRNASDRLHILLQSDLLCTVERTESI